MSFENSATDDESQVNSADEQQDSDATAERELSAASVSSDYKVRGKKAAENGTGVQGYNTASSGVAHGVEGITDSDTDGAAGVYGEASGSSGEIYGIKGFSNSSAHKAAGVRGSATGRNFGVLGRVYDNVSDLPVLGTQAKAGVYGKTDKSSNAHGVVGYSKHGNGLLGWSTNSNGVFARSEDSDSAAVKAYNTTSGAGIHVRNSHTKVDKTGLSAYLDGDQEIDTATPTTVVFNKTNVDHFFEFDESTGVYTVPHDGDYHVSFTIRWQDRFDTGDYIEHNLLIDGSVSGQGMSVPLLSPDVGQNNQYITESYSRTLFGLSKDETISVQVEQLSGSKKSISGSGQETYLTIYKVG